MDDPISIPDDLRQKVARLAESKGISVNELICQTLEQKVSSRRRADTLFTDTAIFRGEAPVDGASNHDDYLYGDAS